MTTCANCPQPAFYVYSVTADSKIYYCSLHLPRFLKNQKNGGAVSRYEETVVTPTKSKKSTTKEPVVEEPVVEEPIIEEPVVEEAPTEE